MTTVPCVWAVFIFAKACSGTLCRRVCERPGVRETHFRVFRKGLMKYGNGFQVIGRVQLRVFEK